MMSEKITEEEFLKEHPGLKGKIIHVTKPTPGPPSNTEGIDIFIMHHF